MNRSNKIRLVDAVRTNLTARGRIEETRGLSIETTRRELTILLDLDPNTSLEELRVSYNIDFVRVGRVSSGPRKSSILIDVLTGREMAFTSLRELARYLDCGVNHRTLSELVDEGCIIPVMGRDKYLIPNRDVDLLQLGECRYNAPVVRLMLRYMGFDVSQCNVPKEMFNMVGLRMDPNLDVNDRKYLMKKLCDYIGREYHTHIARGSGTIRRVTLSTMHRPQMEFESISGAADWLRVRAKDLVRLHEIGEPCPYFGDLYFIEIHREDD